VKLEEGKEETPHCVRGDTYWEGEKDPFPTNSKRTSLLCHSERSEESPQLCDANAVISSEARNLLSSIEMGNSPPSEFPRKDFKFIRGSFEGVMSTPSIERRRPLAKSARGDTYWEGEKDPFPTNPRKDFKSFMGGVGGGNGGDPSLRSG